ncbi:DUF3373 family protein [Desulfothermus sp.]
MLKKTVILLSLFLLFFSYGYAKTDTEELLKQTQELKSQLNELQKQMLLLQQKLMETQKKLEQTQKQQKVATKNVETLKTRVAKAYKHAAGDKVRLSISLEPKFWSIHMDDVYVAPQSMTALFFKNYNPANPFAGGLNGATLPQIQQILQGMQQAGMVPKADKIDVDNDIVRTLKFRLRMDSTVNEHLRFAGRMAVYKVWGDSVGINVNRGGMHDITLDGTESSNPHGDDVKLERAYFVYHNEFNKIKWHLSVGRRPSTEGPPFEYRENLPDVGGSPLATIINWEFDGASLGFNFEDLTGIPGLAFKLCYGSGFESQYGTTSAFVSQPALDDVDLFGFIATLYNGWVDPLNMDLKVMLNYAYAPDISDGFTGLTVMPFAVYKDSQGKYHFEQNTGLFVDRVEPQTDIGKWQAASLLVQTNMLDGALDLFLSGSWTHTEAERVSKIPLYEMLGYSLLSSNGKLRDRDGWGFYGGVRYNLMDYGLKLGFEYNYGSKYWFPFTGAEDNLVASKIATRGHVFEPYFIKSLINDHFFIKAGAQFYKYEYSGSGNPLGEPVDVDDITGMDALFPVIKYMQQYYLSVVYKF